MKPLVQKCAAECLGVFILVFFGCGSIMVIERFPQSLSPTIVPIIFGTVITVLVYALGHVSGAHLNPAVTLAFACAKHFPRKEIHALKAPWQALRLVSQ